MLVNCGGQGFERGCDSIVIQPQVSSSFPDLWRHRYMRWRWWNKETEVLHLFDSYSGLLENRRLFVIHPRRQTDEPLRWQLIVRSTLADADGIWEEDVISMYTVVLTKPTKGINGVSCRKSISTTVNNMGHSCFGPAKEIAVYRASSWLRSTSLKEIRTHVPGRSTKTRVLSGRLRAGYVNLSRDSTD
jgi:hypothetical protein